MRVHVLEREQLIPRPVAEVWPFFADAHNLEALTPPSLRFEIETPGAIQMREGALIAYRLRLRGIPVRWRTRIEAWEPEAAAPRFVDRQLSGPYALWHHTHTFTPVPGGTLMRDRVRYRPPLGALGALARPLVRRELDGIFAFRARVIAKRFGAPPPDPAPSAQRPSIRVVSAIAPTDRAAVVAASDVTRRYGEGDSAVDALRGVSLSVAERELAAIMGPSGSGKSTLMHILAGLDAPTSGSVSVGGEEISAMGDKELTLLRRRHVGFIFQSFNLLPMLTAEENVVLPARIAGKETEDGWLETVLGRVGLTDRRTHRPSELSGGQQQRVAVARALFGRPTVLFADEPTGNLDSRSSEDVLRLLRAAVDEEGQTTVMVTHDPAAAAIAHRVLFLADGLLVHELSGEFSAGDVAGAMAAVQR